MSPPPNSVQPTEQTTIWYNRKCVILCLLVATANFQWGYDLAAIGGLQAMAGFLKVFGYPDPKSYNGYGIRSDVQQLISSLMTLGSFISSMAAGPLSAVLGRRYGLWIACLFNAAAVGIMMGTDIKGVLYFGRLLMGFANGFLATFSNIYTSEITPAHLRGFTVALWGYWSNLGAILGVVADNYCSLYIEKKSYQIPLGVMYIIPAFLGIYLFFVPESPRWLLVRGRDAEAKASLVKIRPSDIPREHLEFEWAEMIRGVEEEKKIAKSVGILDMFRGTDLRRTMLCWSILVAQTGSGIWFLISYTAYFIAILGISEPFKWNIMITCFGFIGSLIGLYLLKDKIGRRQLIIGGAALSGLWHLIIAAVWTSMPYTLTAGYVMIAMFCLFGCTFNASVGAASFPMATELVSSRLRAWTVGSATSANYLASFICNFCSPYFINPTQLDWAASYCFIWCGSNWICAIFFFFFIPEMRGRSLEEIDEIFQARTPTWKFPQYQCIIQEQAVQDVKDHAVELKEDIQELKV